MSKKEREEEAPMINSTYVKVNNNKTIEDVFNLLKAGPVSYVKSCELAAKLLNEAIIALENQGDQDTIRDILLDFETIIKFSYECNLDFSYNQEEDAIIITIISLGNELSFSLGSEIIVSKKEFNYGSVEYIYKCTIDAIANRKVIY